MPVDCCEDDCCETRVWTTDGSTPSWCPDHRPETNGHSEAYSERQARSMDANYHRQRIIENDRGEL